MGKWLDAAMASPAVQGLQPYAVSAISAVSSANAPGKGPIGTKDANGTTENKVDEAVDHPVVQAVLARFPGATVISVSCSPDGTERTLQSGPDVWADPPLSYAAGSAASTAALGPPTSRTRWRAERQWREDFGS
jgi:hypothetical protein